MGLNRNYSLENAKKIIIGLFVLLLSCNSTQEFTEVKEGLYTDENGELFIKLSNKNVRNPSNEDSWKDTIYRQQFYFEYDSIVNINDIINKQEFKTIIPDEKYSDGTYIYSSSYYTPGERMYKVSLKK